MVAQAELEASGPVVAARAIVEATARFHNPVYAPEWSDPGIDAAYEGVLGARPARAQANEVKWRCLTLSGPSSRSVPRQRRLLGREQGLEPVHRGRRAHRDDDVSGL